MLLFGFRIVPNEINRGTNKNNRRGRPVFFLCFIDEHFLKHI